MTNAPCPDGFITLAVAMADAARGISLSHFRKALAVERKSDTTPVTIADRGIEAMMREKVAKAFPDHGFIGEEEGEDRPGASHVWVVDPIDGTKKFITGNPLFGTLIALLRDGQPILGIIDTAALDERWVGARGQGTRFFHGGEVRKVTCRACPAIGDAALYTTSPAMFQGPDAAAFGRLADAVHFPLYGGECYAYGLLASGHADLVIEADMGLYDYLSHVAIVEEAGGRISDWRGRPLGLGSDHRVIAAGDPACHEKALELLQSD